MYIISSDLLKINKFEIIPVFMGRFKQAKSTKKPRTYILYFIKTYKMFGESVNFIENEIFGAII